MISYLLGLISGLILEVINTTGYVGIFLLMALESANIPIPSEIIMPFAGFQSVEGTLSFWFVVFIGAFGNLIGSLFSYWLGYLTRKKIIFFNKDWVLKEVERAKLWINRFGDFAIFISRILPIVRTFISFPLGFLSVKSLTRFSILTFFGSFIWSAILVYLGVIFNKNWHILGNYFRKFDYVILAGIIVIIVWWVLRHRKINS